MTICVVAFATSVVISAAPVATGVATVISSVVTSGSLRPVSVTAVFALAGSPAVRVIFRLI
ncbi:MAG TPA: hypothetical protein VKG24_03295 [Pseudolabrys sp.]|nr:hypothetical protein [Pseudolabrys sp.]